MLLQHSSRLLIVQTCNVIVSVRSMKKQLFFGVKQLLKMLMQNALLPCVYGFWNLMYRKADKQYIICADSHHTELPFSLQRICEALQAKGYSVVTDVCDYSRLSMAASSLRAIRFMKLYAQAKVVFICDNFLPVSSCRKDPRTKVVQLLHSCGLGKKMGYDATDDIPAGYRGFVYRNYDLVTVSSPACVEPLAHSLRHSTAVVRALGTSRTDHYFDPAWIRKCRKDFYEAYPQAKGKTVVLWAPTFRGNAADPQQIGTEQIIQLEKELGDKFFILRKVHPHVDSRYHLSNCHFLTEQLLPVADLMITDYSSIVVDFMFFGKPYVLFAPDWEQYKQDRGMYVDLHTLSPYVVTDSRALKDAVLQALKDPCDTWVQKNRTFHASSCDGHSTDRIIEYLGL